MLERFERFNRRLASAIEWIGLTGLLAMMVVTCVDVFGAKLFRLPVPGSIDLVMLAQLVAISFSTAYALVLKRHVRVEFFMAMVPERIRLITDIVISFFGLSLFVCIVWRLFEYGNSLKIGGEVSPTARIPLFPFSYAIAVACIPVCLIFLHRVLDAMLRMVKK